MRLRLRSSLLGVALLAGALAPIATAGVACAASSAALVVSTGSNNYTYCVELGGSSVNGIQLIQRAGATTRPSVQARLWRQCGVHARERRRQRQRLFRRAPLLLGVLAGRRIGGWSWSGPGASNVTVKCRRSERLVLGQRGHRFVASAAPGYDLRVRLRCDPDAQSEPQARQAPGRSVQRGRPNRRIR